MQLSDVEDTYHSYHTARLHMHMRTDLERRVPSNSPVCIRKEAAMPL